MKYGICKRCFGLLPVMILSLVLGIFVIGNTAPYAMAAESIIYVKAGATGNNSGNSWIDAYTDLQNALSRATQGTQIWVAAGTYTPSSTGDRNATFQLKNGVALYGGFAGTETLVGKRNPETNITILSGDLNRNDAPGVSNGDNSEHVVTASGTDATAVLDGFRIIGGNASYSGGGMLCDNGSPTLANCNFSGNYAVYGGGMSNFYSSPTLTNCTFYKNEAIYGGGMYNRTSSSRPVLTNCTFIGNSAEDYGGGIYNFGSSPTFISCKFLKNAASGGGGMENDTSNPILINCTFCENIAIYGGGMYNVSSSNPTLTNCIFWGDTPEEILNHGSSPDITYSDIQGGYTGAGNINADPLFIDADGADNIPGTADDNLRLQAGSPCIDAGISDGASAFDMEGRSRFDNPLIPNTGGGEFTYYDIGAYERGGNVIYVDAKATGSNNGTSWTDAFTDLQGALLNRAISGDEIWVAAGTYTPSSTDDQSATFQLKNGVALYGGFAGTETQLGERNPETNITILSGDLNRDDASGGNNSENSAHVVTGSRTDATAVLDGFHIIGGNASNSGGGMLNVNGSPTLANCTFSGNTAQNYGGGVYNESSSHPTLTNCTFSGNSSQYYGGGIFNYDSSPTITNCAFSGNTAQDYGGGIANSGGSSPALTNCIFSGNSSRYGGGMSNRDESNPKLTNCTFSENSVQYYGGGIYNDYSNPELIDCTFSGNSAKNYGGGMYNYYGSLKLTNCAFFGNSAFEGGGMVNAHNSSMQLSNCVFSGNSASHGGGMYSASTNLILANCVFFRNYASLGGGMFNESDNLYPDRPILTNCILWGDTSEEIYNDLSLPDITYSDIQGGYAGIGNINSDPLFIDADGADNIPGTADDNLRLRNGSPCIDAGNNSAVPLDTLDLDGDGDVTEPLPYDLDGKVRFYDDLSTVDTGAGVAPIVDMGAYECRILDVTPPSTIASGIPSGWTNNPVTVTLSVTDAGSGAKATYYSTNGSAPSTLYTGPFTLSANGVYTIKYYSVDNANNTEAVQTAPNQVKIDTLPPATAISGILAGWLHYYYDKPTMTLAATDTGSGVKNINYTITPDPRIPNPNTAATPIPGTGSYSVTAASPATYKFANPGIYTVTYYATDNAGNAETPRRQQVKVYADTAVILSPTASYKSATGKLTFRIKIASPFKANGVSYGIQTAQLSLRPGILDPASLPYGDRAVPGSTWAYFSPVSVSGDTYTFEVPRAALGANNYAVINFSAKYAGGINKGCMESYGAGLNPNLSTRRRYQRGEAMAVVQ